MAYFNCTFYSKSLCQDAHFNVYIPENSAPPYKTVYLLHGVNGNENSWVTKTNVLRYAEKRNMALVIPNADRSFYSDMAYGRKYLTYISEELVDFTRNIFSLGLKREDTFIAGYSMGGYGAFKVALYKSETFYACASLSGILNFDPRLNPDEQFKSDIFLSLGSIDPSDIKDSVNNLCYLVNNIGTKPKPALFNICGKQDFLYGTNIFFNDFIKDKGFKHVFKEYDGSHTWDFWDAHTEETLDFFLSV